MENKQFNPNELLESRAKLRGDFQTMATAHVEITDAIYTNRKRPLCAVECISLDMIAHKLARIVTGTAYDADSWKDVAGYATLVVNNMKYEANER